MDLYFVPDDFNNRGTLVQDFESFIWTERYYQAGNFELVLKPTPSILTAANTYKFIGGDHTEALMLVENVERIGRGDQKGLLKISGQSSEALTKVRYLNNSKYFYDHFYIRFTDTGDIHALMDPVGYMNLMLYYGIVDAFNSVNNIPGIVQDPDMYSTGYPSGDAQSTESWDRSNLFDLLDSFSKRYNIAYYFAHDMDTGQLKYRLYRGQNRPNLRISATDDDISDTSFLKSNNNYRNVVIVWYNDNYVYVDENGGDGLNYSGFDRRVFEVNADDISDSYSAAVQKKMAQAHGRRVLKQQRKSSILDGTATPTFPYEFRDDFFLGDIVTLEDAYGNVSQSRVTEYIWSYSSTGLKMYPTFEDTGS